ncbi:MAG: alpha/beta fold hydrolase [Anaerolineae bacterium]
MSWSIQRYLNIRQAYGPAFSPDGERLAFLTNITGIPQVWQVRPDPEIEVIAWPDQLTFEDDRVGQAEFSPVVGDGRLLYTRDVGGNERLQLFLLSADGASAEHISEGHEEAMHLFGSWADDGGQICFAANRRDPKVFDLYTQKVPPGEGVEPARRVWQNDTPGYLFDARISPDGKRIIVVRKSSSFDHTLLEIDTRTGEARMLLERDEPVRYLDVRYTPNGDAVYLITDLDAEFLYVARLSLEADGEGSLITVAAPAWDCTTLALSADCRRLAYVVNAEGVDEIHVLDLVASEECVISDITGSPGIVTDARLVFSPDGRRLAFSYSSSTRTADIYIWDLESDEVRAVTRSSHGGLPVSSFVSPRLIHYPTFDTDEQGEARRIPAWFYQPQDPEGPAAAVVMVHGGPESQFRPCFHFLIQYFLHHGYAVLAPNVRGSTGYGKSYSHLDDVEKRMDSVAELAHATTWLQVHPDIDEGRLVVYGGSYGGFMVLAALTAYPDLWAAGVDIVGISNLATFLENTSDYRRGHREAEYGSLERDREFLERIAPINHIDKVSAPLMVIHGANDPRVPLSEAEQLVEALEEREVPVDFLVFEDEGHGVVKLENKLVAYPAIVDFLNEHVGEPMEQDATTSGS